MDIKKTQKLFKDLHNTRKLFDKEYAKSDLGQKLSDFFSKEDTATLLPKYELDALSKLTSVSDLDSFVNSVKSDNSGNFDSSTLESIGKTEDYSTVLTAFGTAVHDFMADTVYKASVDNYVKLANDIYGKVDKLTKAYSFDNDAWNAYYDTIKDTNGVTKEDAPSKMEKIKAKVKELLPMVTEDLHGIKPVKDFIASAVVDGIDNVPDFYSKYQSLVLKEDAVDHSPITLADTMAIISDNTENELNKVTEVLAELDKKAKDGESSPEVSPEEPGKTNPEDGKGKEEETTKEEEPVDTSNADSVAAAVTKATKVLDTKWDRETVDGVMSKLNDLASHIVTTGPDAPKWASAKSELGKAVAKCANKYNLIFTNRYKSDLNRVIKSYNIARKLALKPIFFIPAPFVASVKSLVQSANVYGTLIDSIRYSYPNLSTEIDNNRGNMIQDINEISRTAWIQEEEQKPAKTTVMGESVEHVQLYAIKAMSVDETDEADPEKDGVYYSSADQYKKLTGVDDKSYTPPELMPKEKKEVSPLSPEPAAGDPEKKDPENHEEKHEEEPGSPASPASPKPEEEEKNDKAPSSENEEAAGGEEESHAEEERPEEHSTEENSQSDPEKEKEKKEEKDSEESPEGETPEVQPDPKEPEETHEDEHPEPEAAEGEQPPVAEESEETVEK